MTDKTEEKPVIRWDSSDYEPDDVEIQWDFVLEDLTELVKEINPDGYWYCKVENFGWRKQSGFAYLEFDDGMSLVSKVLPKTECSFKVFKQDKTLKIQNFHHDSPTGNEWYELKPISCEKFESKTI